MALQSPPDGRNRRPAVRDTSLADWLGKLEAAHPSQIDLGLDRVLAVAKRLGLDRSACPVITVAGTNGKGSCVATLERLLLASGCSTGVYTSPHLRRYNERVRLDGTEVDDARLCAAIEAVDRAREGVSLTYFEHGTLAALQVFREAAPDWLLLEVGLGGRLDAVNIVAPTVAVVTSIGLDHQDWLGPDRESIGREKAGIFRAGIPAVVGDRDPPHSLHETAARLGSSWYAIGDAFDESTRASGDWSWRGCGRDGARVEYTRLPAPRLLGSNVACALQALSLCAALPGRDVLERVLPHIEIEGRMQSLQRGGVECLLDVAHNPDGMRVLVQRLLAAPPAGRSVVVMGAMKDKDCAGIIASLAAVADAWFFCDLPGDRAESAARLAGFVQGAAPATCHAGVSEALDAAFAAVVPGDRLLVCGSFHAVGPALDWFDEHPEGA